MTLPDATVELDCCVTLPTTSDAPVIALAAAACVSPVTFGTETGAGPLDTTRFTAVPGATDCPAAGFWLMTLPDATVELDCCVTLPTTSDAPVIALAAAACVSPVTFGTETGAGPLDTTRFTDVPGATDCPAVGFWLMTLPAATAELDCCVTVPTINDESVIASVAADCVSPETLGTETCAGPVDTTRLTAVPGATDCPAAGV
jgi:hypothetical protein